MGEYEPDDSRDVTQTDKRAPGEPPRTGPREDEARRRATSADVDKGAGKPPVDESAGDPMQQTQTQQGQSQSQAQSSATRQMGDIGNPDRRDMQATPDGPLAGNQPQAINARNGDPSPQYDQYEVNQPQNMHQQSSEHDLLTRQQAGMQEGGQRGFGYGAEAGEEMSDAPDASNRGEDEDASDLLPQDEDVPGAEQRGYGGRDAAEREQQNKE